MSDLREAISCRTGRSQKLCLEHEAEVLAAARQYLSLTETGPRLVDAVDAICEVEFGEDVEEEMWDELLDAGIEVRAALADYLTEEDR